MDTTDPPAQDWRTELQFVVEFMRDLSRQSDPQVAARLYADRLRAGGLIHADAYIAVSRRELTPPSYRITRSTLWKEDINPWKDKSRLPLFDKGLLGELIYSNEPAVIDDLAARVKSDDPAAEYFAGMNFLLAMPQFEDGQALNMSVVLNRRADRFPREKIPTMLMQTNLWGRAVLSSVLRQELKATYDALDRELSVVGDIQRSLLPASLPNIPGLDLAVHYRTSQRAGGDYYDFFPLPLDQWGIFIADVSGHGIPAAVMMAITHAIAHTRPGNAMPPSQMLAYLNTVLERRYTGGGSSFVTAFYGVYDSRTRVLTYASAGHPPPRLAHGGKLIQLDGHAGLPLGIDSPEDYPDHTLALRPGDRMLLYTDGVSEAFNAVHEQFGTEPLDAALCASRGNAKALLDAVLADLQKHCGEVPPADDQTMLAVCVG